MKISDLRVYWKFLTRNKLYTFVSVFGFSISLMFVISLGIYVKNQLSVDDFQEKKDRIFLMTHDGNAAFGNTVPQFVQSNFPEVETYVRMHQSKVDVGRKGTEKASANALYADSTFFNVFSLPLIEGDASRVLKTRQSVVLSQSFANKHYSGKDPIGSALVINNHEYTITGLMEDMPQNTMLPEADFIVNYQGLVELTGSDEVIKTSHNFGFIVFLVEKEGSDLQAKTSTMLEMFKKVENGVWVYSKGFSSDLKLMPLKEAYFKAQANGLRVNNITMITIYASIAILILLIALLNYINLTVAQASFRGKEAAMKKLMGCSRKMLIKQLLVESLIMSAITFAIGVFLAFLGEPFFNDVLGTRLELASQITLPIIIACFAFIVFIAFIAGLLPALFISSFDPIEVVKGTFSRKVKSVYSKGLIVFQYIIAIALLICSFLVKEQIDFMINYDMGYNREGILEMPYALDKKEMNGLKSKLSGIPGVEFISFSKGTILSGGNNMSYEVDGQQFSFQELKVDSVFFKIYGISIIESTGITPTHDTYWINRKAYLAINPDTITHTADFGWVGKKQIAGILSDFKIWSLHSEPGLIRMSYMSDADWDRPWNVNVKLSPGTDYYKTAKLIEKEYSAYSGGEMIEARFVDDLIQQNYTREKKTSVIMTAFTILTIIIMIMGVFAMSLYIIRQKQKEISIRKVNGATEVQILLMLNFDSLKRILIAFVVACPIAYYAITKWLEQFPYKISVDWWVFALAGIVVLLLTLLSVSWMTWNAARANPIKFLKAD